MNIRDRKIFSCPERANQALTSQHLIRFHSLNYAIADAPSFANAWIIPTPVERCSRQLFWVDSLFTKVTTPSIDGSPQLVRIFDDVGTGHTIKNPDMNTTTPLATRRIYK